MDSPSTYSAEFRPTTTAEVAAALRSAAADGKTVSVRSGGHSEAYFPNRGGVLIDLAGFDEITVGDAGVVTIGAGQTWGEVARTLGEHALGLSSGDTESVGVGGLTLGGGIGWMTRQYGLALDSLISAEVVVADGQILTASESENADLFWALRGGGGNFGVVTRFRFQAHPLDGVVFARIQFDGEKLPEVLRGLRDVMRTADERLTVTLLMLPAFGPDAPASNALNACWGGVDETEAAAAFAPLLALPGILSSQIAPSAYVDILDPAPPEPPAGAPMPTIVAHNALVDDLDDAAIDALVEVHHAQGMGPFMARTTGGAFGRVARDATAFAYRSSEMFVMAASVLMPGVDPSSADGFHEAWAAFEPSTAGVYGNFAPEASNEITSAMYPPDTLERLREAKRVWDPSNLFAHNHNIAP